MVKKERHHKGLDIMPPEAWIKKHIDLVPSGGRILDLAAGAGRHTRLALDIGYRVLAVDRDISQLDPSLSAELEIRQCDLETGTWRLEGETFAGVIVSNYLWRPLFPHVVRSLAPGGILLWSTFAEGNERFGRPRNPDFLLAPNELLEAFSVDLEVLHFEHREFPTPRASVRQSICARRPVVDPVETGC